MSVNTRQWLPGGTPLVLHLDNFKHCRLVFQDFFGPLGVQPFVARISGRKLARVMDCLQAVITFSELVKTLGTLDEKVGQFFFGRERPQITYVRNRILSKDAATGCNASRDRTRCLPQRLRR